MNRGGQVVLLVVWFSTSIFFNYLTPEFQTYLTASLDITMVELVSASAYGLVIVPLMGLSILPSRSLCIPMLKIGVCHLAACRLFIIAVCGENKIPVSLAQTIRAANPLFVVVVSFLFTGARYPTAVLLSLIPLLVGFAMASLSEVHFAAVGFFCALASVTILVILSLVSKKAFTAAGKEAPHWAQVQLWSCVIAVLVQMPTWVFGGGSQRVMAALTAENGSSFVRLIVTNGLMYYAEQVMQFMAIHTYLPLSYSVIDTVRRLTIVVVTGYFLRGDVFTPTKCAGVLVVCGGAVFYNYAKEKGQKLATKKD